MMRLIENSRPFSQDMEDYGHIVKRKATSSLINFANEYILMGCSPRRNFHIEAAAKAWAWMMRGDDKVARVDDIKAIVPITTEHVILLGQRAMGDNITTRNVVEKLLNETEVP